MRAAALLVGILLLTPGAPSAQAPFDPFSGAAVEDRIGAAVPLDLDLTDSRGRPAMPPDGASLLVVPVDFGCANICGVTLRGLLTALGNTALAPGGFEVWVVSIDGRDGREEAAQERRLHEALLADLPDSENVRFLTGGTAPLTDSIGFRYAYDPASDQFAHAAAVAVVTPEGRLARWLYGYPFQASDLRLALVEAGNGETGTLADRLWLLCYGYDPETGTYTLAVERALQAGGGLTILALGGFVLVMLRRERGSTGATGSSSPKGGGQAGEPGSSSARPGSPGGEAGSSSAKRGSQAGEPGSSSPKGGSRRKSP